MDRVTPRRWAPAALAAVAAAGLAAAARATPEGLGWHLAAGAVGFASGLAGGLVAGAIGLIAIPLLVVGLGLPLREAAATNLVQTAATAALGAWRHLRLGLLDLRVAALVLLGSLAGAPLGAWASLRLPTALLGGVFALALLAAAAGLAWRAIRPRAASSRPAPASTPARARPARSITLGAGLGFASGLLGVGAGFLVLPGLTAVADLPVHLAVGTGLAVVSGNSLLGALPHLAGGRVHWLAAAWMALGGALGVRVGTRVGRAAGERTLRGVMAAVLALAAWALRP